MSDDEIFDKVDDMLFFIVYEACFIPIGEFREAGRTLNPPGKSMNERSVNSGSFTSTTTVFLENESVLSFLILSSVAVLLWNAELSKCGFRIAA
jgi:hypothetical protein